MHIGFHKSWIANDLDEKVKERVMEIIKDHKGTTKMYITGDQPLLQLQIMCACHGTPPTPCA